MCKRVSRHLVAELVLEAAVGVGPVVARNAQQVKHLPGVCVSGRVKGAFWVPGFSDSAFRLCIFIFIHFYFQYVDIRISIFVYTFVCVCVCVCKHSPVVTRVVQEVEHLRNTLVQV